MILIDFLLSSSSEPSMVRTDSEHAETGYLGQEPALKQNYDALILDINLPDTLWKINSKVLVPVLAMGWCQPRQ